jgi:tight adherence protein B
MNATALVGSFLAMAAVALLLVRLAMSIGAGGSRMFGQAEMELAGLFIFVDARRIKATTVLAVAVVALAAFLADVPSGIILMLMGAAAALPMFLVRVLRARRRARIALQLPDALAMWAGLLRSGQGVSQALGQVAARQAPPLRDDLGVLLRQHRVGVPIEKAVREWSGRTDLPDLGMLSTLLHATRELGGNLAESLARLADIMRKRMVMEARIRALTSQGKLQGLIVGLLPVLLMSVLGVMEPEAMRKLYQTHAGWAVLAAILALEVTGFVIIRRIVNIEV